MTITVQQLLNRKGNDEIYSVTPDMMVYDAINMMNKVNVGALLVLENDRLCGIISERDYTRKVILQNKSSQTTPVRDIMTEKVLYVTPDQTINECLVVMSKNHIRHLPVLQGTKPIGVLSVMDVVENIISEKELIIQQLENYISGVG
ncbi:MAG: CBS domain-containing protein [Gammaproteobacteria bacterium]|nr:CBS domain-containing protein [Gammaproteobacteria bacterium]